MGGTRSGLCPWSRSRNTGDRENLAAGWWWGAGRCELGPWAAVMERRRCFGQRNTHWILEKGSKKVRAVPLGCSGRVSMLEKVGFLLKKDAGCEA